MASTESPAARVTIVITPRERFGLAVASLESVLAGTEVPFALVYVDAGSPESVHRALAARAASVGGTLLREEGFLPPNVARNRAWPHIGTEYVAYLDNDVLVEAGWLRHLVDCADRTGAAVVGPLTLFTTRAGTVVHLVGGELAVEGRATGLWLDERHVGVMQDPAAVRRAEARECGFAEFHTLLARSSVLATLGPLDEALLSTREHLDLALLLRRAGHAVYVEPASCVTYVQAASLPLGERAFFLKRWRDDWDRRSTAHFAAKWNLDPASPVFDGNQAFVYDHQAACPLPDPDRAARVEPAPVTAHGYAQTPAQLYEQLRAAGVGSVGLDRAQRACDAAIAMFSGISRACGKPFLCHGIGTASILVRCGAPLALSLAGLCHAAYSHGRFPREIRRSPEAKRKWLRKRVGGAVERLVHHYDRFDWSAGPPACDLDTLDSVDAAVMLLRMANDVEERLDLALALTEKPALAHEAWQPFLRMLADALGVGALATELARAVEATARAAPASVPRSAWSASYVIDRDSLEPQPFFGRRRRRRSLWRRIRGR